MKVRYEPALPQLSYDVLAPLPLDVEGSGCAWVERWSLDGIVRPRDIAPRAGYALVTIPFQGFGITFRARLDDDPEIDQFRFAEIGQLEAEVLRNFYRRLVTGP